MINADLYIYIYTFFYWKSLKQAKKHFLIICIFLLIKVTIKINTYIYNSTTRKTKLHSNLLFCQSCIYKRWTHILLPSQHSCVNSAADHPTHLHLTLPSITSLIAAVRLESDHGWERDIEAVLSLVNREFEEDHDDAPWTTQPWSKSGRTCVG